MPNEVIFNKKYAFSESTIIQMDTRIDMGIMDWVKKNYELEYENEWLQVYR